MLGSGLTFVIVLLATAVRCWYGCSVRKRHASSYGCFLFEWAHVLHRVFTAKSAASGSLSPPLLCFFSLQRKLPAVESKTSTWIGRTSLWSTAGSVASQVLMLLQLLFLVHYITAEVDEVRLCFYQRRGADSSACSCACVHEVNRRARGVVMLQRRSDLSDLSLNLSDRALQAAAADSEGPIYGYCKAGPERCFCHRTPFRWHHAILCYLRDPW